MKYLTLFGILDTEVSLLGRLTPKVPRTGSALLERLVPLGRRESMDGRSVDAGRRSLGSIDGRGASILPDTMKFIKLTHNFHAL